MAMTIPLLLLLLLLLVVVVVVVVVVVMMMIMMLLTTMLLKALVMDLRPVSSVAGRCSGMCQCSWLAVKSLSMLTEISSCGAGDFCITSHTSHVTRYARCRL